VDERGAARRVEVKGEKRTALFILFFVGQLSTPVGLSFILTNRESRQLDPGQRGLAATLPRGEAPLPPPGDPRAWTALGRHPRPPPGTAGPRREGLM